MCICIDCARVGAWSSRPHSPTIADAERSSHVACVGGFKHEGNVGLQRPFNQWAPAHVALPELHRHMPETLDRTSRGLGGAGGARSYGIHIGRVMWGADSTRGG